MILTWSRALWSLPPPRPQPAFSLGNISQRTSVIREVRNAETKEDSQRRPNNNNVVTRHSQGLVVPSQRLEIIFWAISCELMHRYWKPRWKKLTMTTRLYPEHKRPQFREPASKKWEQMDPGTEAIVPKTIKMILVGPPMTNVKAVRADPVVSAWSLPRPTLSIEDLTPCLLGERGWGWREGTFE